ncbi:MAG: tetratricopeptide repeat protein [Planctomycetaceae bacterium]|jgi:tetratricopeptide (TPR) repeat protein|nr:tetratricopeptide repeat protein [Planctomycetaceae bacterium]
MTVSSECCCEAPKLAVGIVADAESVAFVPQSVKSASELTDRIFILAVGDNLKIEAPAATVINGGWDYDDAASRNFLIDAVEEAGVADYILWMNPGETFDTQTRNDFLSFVQDDIKQETIYMMVLHRLVHEDGKCSDFDEETIDGRLMPLHKGVRFKGTIKASLLERSAALMIQISAAPGRIILPPKQIDPFKTKKYAEKALRFLDRLENEGEVISDALLLYQGEALLTLDNSAAARRVYRQLIRTTERSELRLAAYYGFWETLIKSPIPDADVTKWLIEALDHYPVDMQLLTFLGSHLQRIGKPDLASRSFETAVRHGRITLDVWHRLRIKEIAVISLALSLRLLGKNQEAIAVLEEHLPQFRAGVSLAAAADFSRHLLDLYIQENEEEKAGDLAANLWGDAILDQMRLVIKGACLAKQGNWAEALLPLSGAYDSGCREVLGLRWYALTLLSQKEFEKAAVILDQWIAVEPNNLEAKSYKSAAAQPDNFCKQLRSSRDRALKAFGVPADNLVPRRNAIRIDDAVQEMMQSSASLGGKITGFKPKAPETNLEVADNER